MGWVDRLRGQIIAIDTAPLIYFIEEHPTYLPVVLPFFEALDRGDVTVITSVVTLVEVLVHPLRQNDHQLVQQYREILTNVVGLTTFPLTPDIAEIAADLRAKHNLRTPDAIQLATASHKGARYFLSNDMRLPSLTSVKLLLVDDYLRT